MYTILKGTKYPTIKASSLKNGMLYWDGSEISEVKNKGKTVHFMLEGKTLHCTLEGKISRAVRASSLIILAPED